MSESGEMTPRQEEIISTPGADMLVPTPAEIQLNGAVQVSERQQARRENWRLIRRRPAFVIGVFIVIVWTVCAIFGNQIAPHNALDFRAIPHLHPGGSYLFGTDNQGRDVLSRVIVGARDVIKVAPVAAVLGVFFGVLVGNNGVRQFLRGIAVLQMMFAVWVLAMASGRLSSGVLAVIALFGLGIPVFYFYTLGRDDVRDWMFRKNFHVPDDVDTDVPKL